MLCYAVLCCELGAWGVRPCGCPRLCCSCCAIALHATTLPCLGEALLLVLPIAAGTLSVRTYKDGELGPINAKEVADRIVAATASRGDF